MPFSFSAAAPLRSPNPFLRRRQAIASSRKPEDEADLKMFSLAKPQVVPFRRGNSPYPPVNTTTHTNVVEPLPVDTAYESISSESIERESIIPAAVVPVPGAPTSAAQSSPVERFKSVNKNLPDGVRYEPLDKETLRLLKEAGGAAAKTQASPIPPVPEVPRSSVPAEKLPPNAPAQHNAEAQNNLLEQLMQDERNAGVFYAYLAETAPRPDFGAALQSIAKGCGARLQAYGNILSRTGGGQFVPKETDINKTIPFERGVSLAISEENKAILALTEWLDNKPDADTARLVQNIINKKITNHNVLSFISTNLDFPFKF